MKIQCDVCEKEQANVFCPADEAALCEGCDNSIHHANKLASQHARFSLLHPSFKEAPVCDICKERRAFVFCKEDRAILCRECDVPIHKANEHTQKHNRFLLTGVKLHTSSSSSNGCDAKIDAEITSPRSSIKRPKTIPNEVASHSSSGKIITPTYKDEENQISDSVPLSTSSISEYLMETLPGWRVEDFLDPSIATNGFCKTYDQSLPFVDQDLERHVSSFSAEDLATWVPQVSRQSPPYPLYLPQTDFPNGFNELAGATNVKIRTRKWSDDGFTVPQISTPSLKKSRHFG
ncbi:hypothetical protein FH972_005075 [Carpinus fangiana]|uniref:B box-type domain-containing protein n=1 Tax=Carpinus fangiana TaxID=176857 RepID=A0A5N6QN43_9ROSI|nr:hypothetical protein FH972_005075 [Carpinus fangiana]